MIGHGRGRRSGALLVAGCLAAAPALAAEGRPEVPRPDVSYLDEAGREQLAAGRARLEALEARGAAEPVELAAAYGDLGQLYYLYDLTAAAYACFVNARTLAPDDARWHYFLGAAEALQGRPEAAAASFVRALELRGDDSAAWIRLGDVRLELRQPEEAERAYRRALQLRPQSAAAHYGLGRVHFDRGELEEAAARFERALELQPEATSIHHSLGMALRGLGRMEEARAELGRNRGGRVRFADPLIEELAARLAGGQRFFTAAVEAVKAGELTEAIRLFERAGEEDPDDHLVPYNLGLAYLRQGDRERAARALARSVEIEPDFRNGHFNLGILLAEQGRDAEAETHFRRAHEIDPLDGAAHVEWAVALSRIGRPGEAMAELGKLLEAEPGHPRATLNLGLLQARAGRWSDAVATLRRAVTLDAAPAELAAAYLQLGRLEEAAGDPAAALAAYQRAVELAPEEVEGRMALAGALGRAGRFAAAAEEFAAAVERRPELQEAQFGLAMARLLGGDDAGARAALEAALAAQRGSLPLEHLLARLLATSSEAAVRDGERALEIALRVFQRAQSVDHAETVAMALAEVGRFEEAVRWQGRAVAERERAGGSAAAARGRLELYRRGEPCRAPWRSG